MLGQLAESAAAEGVDTFGAVVLPGNRRMLGVFRDSGFPVESHAEPDEVHVVFPTRLDAAGLERSARRLRSNAAAAVAHVLRPASIAVIGASARPGSVGAALLANLSAFHGPVYEVNRRTGPYRSVADLPEVPEAAVVAVPAGEVVDVARACAAHGVLGLIVLSAGFAETGADGARMQDELLAVCRDAGMRLLGPNSLGAFNTDPEVRFDATFAYVEKAAGTIAFASQSGAFGITAVHMAARRGMGLSAFASLGNKADLSGNDLLEAWEEDPRATVIALYLESFGNPRRFGAIARRVTQTKPVVVVKAGRTAAGRRAASSHTGALAGASDATVDALFRHAGVIRTDTVAELFDTASVLARQPLPRGPRVAIVTNAGGPGILGADACAAAGLHVVPLSDRTRTALRAAVPGAASLQNPVDLVATATPAQLREAVAVLRADPGVDAIIAAHVVIGDEAAEAADALAGPPADKPVLGVLLGADAPPGLALFGGVEEAARALAHAVAYAHHRAEEPDPPPELGGIDGDLAVTVIAEQLGRGEGWLPAQATAALLSAYGIPLAPARTVATPRAVRHAAAELGGHVAVKAIVPDLVHKTEAGAVRLGLRPAGAERAARELREALPGLEGFLVQRMATGGTELLAGITSDPKFGPLVAIGAGGTTAELSADVQLRLAPVGRREATEMVRGLRCFPLLEGYRGAPPADVAAVEDIVLRLGRLAADQPAVAELDCNPVVAGPAGAIVVDARVRVVAPPPRAPFGALNK